MSEGYRACFTEAGRAGQQHSLLLRNLLGFVGCTNPRLAAQVSDLVCKIWYIKMRVKSEEIFNTFLTKLKERKKKEKKSFLVK